MRNPADGAHDHGRRGLVEKARLGTFPNDETRRAASRSADEIEFARIVMRERNAIMPRIDLRVGAHGDGHPIGLRLLSEIIHGIESVRSRHVLDDDARMSRYVIAQMTRKQTRVDVVAAAGRVSDQQGHGLAMIKIVASRWRGRERNLDE